MDIEKQRLEETNRSTSLSGSISSKEFAPPPDWPTRDRRMEQKPGAFRAGAMTRADEENAGGDEDQSLAATTMNPADGEQEAGNTNIIHATLVTDVEAPSPPPVARDDSAEIYKAELLPSNGSAEEQSKTSKRRWLWMSLIACALMVTAASVAVTITVLLKDADERNEAEAQEGFNEDDDPSSSHSGDEPEFLLPADLLSFDRITHHVAFFDWGTPSRCSLGMDNPLEFVEESLFVRINCGTGDRSEENGAALVFWPELSSEGIDCIPHRMDGMKCNRSSDAGMARVAFTCGTHSANYETIANTNSGAVNTTALINIQETEVQCDIGNSTVMDGEDEEDSVRIGLTVGRICFSPGEPRLRFPEECVGSKSELDEPTELSLPDGGVACIRQSDPCPAEGSSSCAFGLDSFSAADSSNDPECQSASLGSRQGEFVEFMENFLENFPAGVLEIFN